MSEIEIKELYKGYVIDGKKKNVLNGLNLSLEKGMITVLLGRSGSGKTTLLRMIAGLEICDSGEIYGPSKENICMMFQESRLMPWLNIEKNILFAVNKQTFYKANLEHIVSLVGLKGFEKAYPNQLSVGMKQRVSLARALAYKSEWMLMDEPFSALDPFTRFEMQQELLEIQKIEKKSMLIVTHSVDEAITLADIILILKDGKIISTYRMDNNKKSRDLLSNKMLDLKRKILQDLELRS